ncbi:MAG TPA: kelch repeat-containing protein [Phycisphaerales bacterium]|nr:kelch repeat-containing protein [Phycisphaerales bacterium]
MRTAPNQSLLRALMLTLAATSCLCDATVAQCTTVGWQLVDDAMPSGRWRHAMAVDTDRNVLVLFGGQTGENDTWECDLATNTWTRRDTPTKPDRRYHHAMVYDRARGAVVMTGGQFNGNPVNSVWEYSVVSHDWALVTPALPDEHVRHAMCYDTARDTIVLYGGVGTGGASTTDVWERGPTSRAWTARPAGFTPGEQADHALVFDSVRNRTILAESRSQSAGVVGIFEWDGVAGAWTPHTFLAGPDPRLNPAMAFDASRGRTLLFGGETSRDVREYDGTAWVSRAQLPDTAGRDEHAAAYDPLNSRVLAYGGFIGNRDASRSLLAYSGASNAWTTVSAVESPSPRSFAAAAYDPVGQKTVMYGGGFLMRPGIVQSVSAGTWTFNGSTWAPMTVTGTPPPAWYATMVHDSARRRMVLYGGRTAGGADNAADHIWEFDLATSAWIDRTATPSSPPGRRSMHAAAYDPVAQRMVVYGGLNQNNVRLGDTWLYDGVSGDWTNVSPPGPTPGVRSDAAMVFDASRGVTVLFGGQTGTQVDNATWEWNGSAWSNVTPATGNPTARRRHALLYDPIEERVLLVGGVGTAANAAPLADVWAYDGQAWSQLPVTNALPAFQGRVGPAVAFDATRNQIVQFGGESIQNGEFKNGQTFAAAVPGTSSFTIACARQAPLGLSVVLNNVRIVNAVDLVDDGGSASITLEDASGSLTVFGSNAMIQSIMATAEDGNVLASITGTTASFNGLFELTTVTQVASTGTFQTTTPIPITAADLADGSPTAEALESRLVVARDYVFSQIGQFVYTPANGYPNNGITVRLPSAAVAAALNAQFGGIPTGLSVDVIGVLGQFDTSAPYTSGYEFEVTAIVPRCDSLDFNLDGLFPDNLDLLDFLSVFGGGVCDGQASNDPPCNPDIDFNNDGLYPDNEDILSLFRVFGGGAC